MALTRYESLMSEYDELLSIEERDMKSCGLYCDNIIWINKNMMECKKCCVLAEEIGHHYTTAGNILNLTDIKNIKKENIARDWAINKLLPFDEFINTVKAGNYTIPDVAEYLGLDEEFICCSIEHYKRKLGVEFPICENEL
ncbi:MAG: ImmA/IrrE family metallo-endopeptidase [Aminipila sp.]